MLASMAAFETNYALIKLATQSIPASQLIFVRGVFATVLLVACAYFIGVPIRLAVVFKSHVLTRAGLDALASVSFILAIAHMQLANASAIGMVTPLIATLLAVFAFRETVSARSWLLIVAGLLGVVLVVQPAGDAFNASALLMLLSALFTACRDLVTRVIDKEIPSLLLTLVTVAVTMLLSAGWGIVQEWRPLSPVQVAILAGAGAFVSSGFLLVTIAMREGRVGVISPFRYSAVIFSSILGYAIWGDLPNTLAWCGIVLIVLSGLQMVRAS
jgi:drug/metabolite transporter (DMT)-like permease